MAKKKKWHGGLSDCCDAPIEEIGEGITALFCGECGQMCNVKREDDEDDFPEDFFDNE